MREILAFPYIACVGSGLWEVQDYTGAPTAVCLVRERGELQHWFFACCYAEQPGHPVERSVSKAADAPLLTTWSLQPSCSARVPTGNRRCFPSRSKAAPKDLSEPEGERPGVNTIQITSMQV